MLGCWPAGLVVSFHADVRGALRLFFFGRELQSGVTLREAWGWHTGRESHTQIQVFTNLRWGQSLAEGHAGDEGADEAEDEEGSEGGGSGVAEATRDGPGGGRDVA